MKDLLVVIVGPTATGKSATAIELAKAVGGEIISGDSVQVYRKLDIGSAKVTADEQEGIPHYMVDILDPDQEFSVAQFQKLVRKLIREINSRGKIPILVGGTGLYIRSVLDPYEFPSTTEDKAIRQKLHRLAEREGKLALHNLLTQIDPESAQRLHPNDVTRVVRALEVYELTGKPFSQYQQSVSAETYFTKSLYRLVYCGLNAPREVLYARINDRVDFMLEQGLIKEVEEVLADGLSPFASSLKTIGYRHVVQYLRGLLTYEEMVRLLKRDTRHFAKRQLTWFCRDPRIIWFDIVNTPLAKIVGQMVEMICSAQQDSVQ